LVLPAADVLSVATCCCGVVGREAEGVYVVDAVGPPRVAVELVRAPMVSEVATTLG